MRYFLSLISVLLSFGFLGGFLSLVHADVDNITTSGFKIELNNLDPFTHTDNSANAGTDTVGGISAATELLGTIASMLLFVIPLIAVVSLIVAGYYYILSGGDSEKASQAKTIIKWNLVAIMIALLSYTLIYLLAKMLDGTLF